MNRLRLVWITIAMTAAPLAAQIQISGLDRLAERATNSTTIDLDANVMKMAAAFLSQQDKDQAKVKTLLGGLQGIHVHSFEFEKKGQYSQQDVESIRSQLQGPQWSRIVSVQEKGEDAETAEIYTRMVDGKVAGFAIITAEPKELTVVAIEGSIALEDLAALGGQFGVPQIPVSKGSSKDKQKGKQTK